MSPAASAHIRVTLPSGLWCDEVHLRIATLRPIDGADEEALLEASGERPAVRAALLLGRCLLGLEAERSEEEGAQREASTGDSADRAEGFGPSTAQRLSVGDREALLLQLRRHTFGEVIDSVLDCPRQDCRERMDLSLAVDDLLLSPYLAPQPVYEATFDVGEEGYAGAWTLRFLLPSGADQDAAAARLTSEGASAAVELLAERCLVAVTGPSGAAVQPEEWRDPTVWPALRSTLSAAIADSDPQAEILLHLTCPSCGESFSSHFDTATYLLAELAAEPGALYRQVHALACHYHWSEADILAMTPRKRRLYLTLLADDTTGAAGAGLARGAAA